MNTAPSLRPAVAFSAALAVLMLGVVWAVLFDPHLHGDGISRIDWPAISPAGGKL
jgi:hypothetical protein